MTREEWQLTWIKELTKFGISFEGANRAFYEEVGTLDNVDVTKNPFSDVQKYLGKNAGT